MRSDRLQSMLRRLVKAVVVAVPLLAIGGFALYLIGLRIVLDGGGGVHLRFVESQEARAERIARHRSAQKVDPAVAASPAAAPTPAPAAPAGSGTPPDIAAAATTEAPT